MRLRAPFNSLKSVVFEFLKVNNIELNEAIVLIYPLRFNFKVLIWRILSKLVDLCLPYANS